MQMTVTTSKEAIERSYRLLQALEHSCICFYPEHEPKSEYIFQTMSTNVTTSSVAILAVAIYDNDTYAVYASEDMPDDCRAQLFADFAKILRSGNHLIVFTNVDLAAALDVCCKEVDVKFAS